jgi:hypothetical protein
MPLWENAMLIFVSWLGLAIVVAVAANTRGRNPLGWFLLAVFISPLLAGLLALALPSLAEPQATSSQSATDSVFVPSGVLSGVPYRAEAGGQVTAMMPGGAVRFADMDQLVAALSGKTVAPAPAPDRSEYRNNWNGVSYKINADNSISAWTSTGEIKFDSWSAFEQAHGRLADS